MADTGMTTPKEYVQEFIKVLTAEIEELKASKDNNIALTNGIRQGNKAGRDIYQFTMDRALTPINNVVYKLIAGTTLTECELVSIDGNQIILAASRTVSMEQDIRLFIDRTALPEKLLQGFRETLQNADQRYENAARLFNGQFRQYDQDIPDLSGYDQVNDYQKAAVVRSVQGDTIIWGPPGTGKTHTIAVAINEQIKQGRRVLLLSHANTAVDGAMEELAELLQEAPVYTDGRLVRMGVSQTEQYPMLSLEEIVRVKAEELDRQLKGFEAQLLPLQESYSRLQEIRSLQEACQHSRNKLSQAAQQYERHERQIERYLDVDSIAHSKELHALQAKLTQLENKTFQFPSTKEKIAKQKQQIEDHRAFIKQRQEEMEQLRARQPELRILIANLKQSVQQFNRKFLQALIHEKLTEASLEKECKKLSHEIDTVEQQIKELERRKGTLRKQVIEEALVIGATLSMTFMSSDLQAKKYDALFIDEISMAPLLPMFFAMGLIRRNCVLIGDFLQLPPIGTQSDHELLKKWEGDSFFKRIGVNTVRAALNSEFVKPLSVQYRMNPAIADVSNELFYGGILKSGENTKSRALSDHWVQNTPLVLVDTSKEEPWMNRGPNGKSRCNLSHGVLAAAMANRYLEYKTQDGKDITVGVIVPYRPQKDLINNILDESLGKGTPDRKRIEVNTVHSFQGGEKDIIICDSVESKGLPCSWFFFDESNRNSSAPLMLNVAITRAKCKFILLANVEYVQRNFQGESFKKLLDILSRRGKRLIASDLGFGFQTKNEENELKYLSDGISVEELGQYNQKSFWAKIMPDLKNARRRVIIFCPFVRSGRIDLLLPTFQEIISSGGEVTVYTRSVNEHTTEYQKTARDLLDKLRQHGLTVRIRRSMHEKVILIDDSLVWQGSLNLLSHKSTTEQMQRISSEKVQKEVIAMIDLDSYKKVQASTDPAKRCELCGGLLVQKSGAYGSFYGCVSFPDCGFTRPC